METPTWRRHLPRAWVWVGGGLVGVLGSMLGPGPAGCVYHDTCIKVTSPGHDWCRNLGGAIQWPAGGSMDDAEPVLDEEGDTPQGCLCFNDADHQILEDELPACVYDELLDELEQAVRAQCQSLVKAGFDHNCWTVAGANASSADIEFSDTAGSCIGNCEYGGPPAGGSCPEPNPYECATGDGGHDCAPLGDDDTGTTGDQSMGLELDPEAVISCIGHSCEIDESFARGLYHDPSPLVSEGTWLTYDSESRRHVFKGVAHGSILYTLGLRGGDRLERIGTTTINSLEAALEAYIDYRDANPIELRVQRGDQWVDLTYTFVP